MFFESTIMGNTADLAMVQKTIIDTFHKEGKSQRVITEGGESFTRSELKLESVHQESPRSDIFRKRATKPLLKQKHRQKHLIWAKEKNNSTVDQWSKVLFSDFTFHLKSRCQSLEEEWRGTESMLLEVQCEVSTVGDDLGCHVICWCLSTVFSEVHSQRSHLPGNFRALHASFCWQALWICWFNFPAGHSTCPHCQRYQKLVQWPWCYCAWMVSKLLRCNGSTVCFDNGLQVIYIVGSGVSHLPLDNTP